MISRKFSKLLTAYVDGELGLRQRKAVRRMLRQSSRARKLYRQMMADSIGLQTLPTRMLRQDLSGTILDKINKTLPDIQLPAAGQVPGRRLFALRPSWVAAAAVLLAVAAGSYIYFGGMVGSIAPVASNVPAPEPMDAERRGADDEDADAPRRSSPENVFAFPNLKVPQVKLAQVRVPSIFDVGDWNQAAEKSRLLDHLRGDALHRLDLFTANGVQGLERLREACRAQNIEVRIDPAAEEFVNRGMERTWALYVENLTAQETASLLLRLGADDKKAGIFGQAVLTATTPDELASVLGGTGKELAPPSQRPVDQGTAGQILSSLPRQGPEPVRQRRMIVVPYEAPRETPYDEVKNLLDGYREVRPGSMQLLIVLWGKDS